MPADPQPDGWQGFWETPRNVALIVAAAAGVAGVLGFKLGQHEPIGGSMQIVVQPGAIVLSQPDAASASVVR